jgi:hypothetical protein
VSTARAITFANCGARLGSVKALRFARPRCAGLAALTEPSVSPEVGNYVMAVGL